MMTLAVLSLAQPGKVDSLNRILAHLPPIGQSRNTDTLRIKTLNALGLEEPTMKNALQYLNQALDLAKQQSWVRGEMWANAYIGLKLGRSGSDYKACEYLFRSLYLAETLKDEACMGYSLRFLGDSHNKMGDRKKGQQFFLKALPHLKRAHDWRRYLITINNIGLGYLDEANYDRAITYFNICLMKNKQIGLKEVEALGLINLATCYEKKGNLKQALHYISQFRALNFKNADDLADADSQTARILLAMGDKGGALRYAKQAENRENKIRSATSRDIYNTLYTIYTKQGDFRLALTYYQKLIKLKDINTADMQRQQIDALRIRYENDNQKAIIQSNETERKILIGGLILFLLFVGLLVWNNQALNRKNREIEAQRFQIMEVKERLAESNIQLTDLNNTLEARVRQRTEDLTLANEELIRMNHEIKEAFFNGQSLERKRVASELHDNLGSTLSGLKWQFEALDTDNYTTKERKIYERVLTLIGEAYSDVRNLSHNLMPVVLEKNGLTAALQNLVDDLNRGDRTQFSFMSTYIAGHLEKKAEMELYSISLELITNILKHAQATEASIELDFLPESNQLILSFIDNGIGLPDDIFTRSEGMGLRNLQNRIISLNGQMEIAAVVPQGTAFTLTLVTAYNS
ncbi:hypothetical protein GCM10028805_48700 [Spirosoma harenae]